MKKLLLFLTVLLVVGCGARKVSKSQVEVKQETTSTTKDTFSQVSKIIETKIDTTSKYEECIEAIDSTKEIEININGKIIKGKNIRYTTRKIKNGISVSKQKDNVTHSSKNASESISTQIESNEKDIDREPSFNLWWILIIAAALLLYYEYKKE